LANEGFDTTGSTLQAIHPAANNKVRTPARLIGAMTKPLFVLRKPNNATLAAQGYFWIVRCLALFRLGVTSRVVSKLKLEQQTSVSTR
jgi:hypothetical protein